ncbi:MAG: alpha/beta hydrolase [Prevotellaceae bacterium]|jgi:predicted peptidase|nr:alpha/beta hydrolase [Prevotellaceae bacterium]
MKNLITLLCMMFCVETVMAQRVIEQLKTWLAQPRSENIAGQKFARKSLSQVEASEAAKLLFSHKQQLIREKYGKQWEEKRLTEGKYVMKFDYRVFGEKPADGRSLYISMHGGGHTSDAVNDRQWSNQIRLYEPDEGVYLAPRAAVNDWNLWFQPHVDTLFDRIIQLAVAYMDVNPDKVYLLGYSAGGDGAYRMAPRLADRWAAASMMAGHPGGVSPLNLRNTGFSLWMGERDSAYNRNAEAVRFGQLMDSLNKADPKGYIHETHIVPERGHWMNRADTAAVPWMAKFRRNAIPQKIVWRQDDTPHESFYWLSVTLSEIQQDKQLIVEHAGNTFTILKNDYKTVKIGLNDSMIDFDKPVKVIVNGKVVFNKKVVRTIEDICNSIEKRSDPSLIFSAFINGEWKMED